MNIQNLNKLFRGLYLIRSFPAVEQEAIYHQMALLIELLTINSTEFDQIKLGNLSRNNYIQAATIRHELTHFLDHIGTLHGQQNIVMLFNAINAFATGTESEFFWVASLMTSIKKDAFLDYYTEVNTEHQASFRNPWKHRITSGLRLDFKGNQLPEKPLMFVRFMTESGIHLARTPISVAALHETNAVYNEYLLKAEFINSMHNASEKKDEQDEFNADCERILYSTDHAVYSVAAHVVADMHNLTQMLDIYSLSSALATLTLNVSTETAQSIPVKLIDDDLWDGRFRALASEGDKGYIFYRLAENLKASYGEMQYSLANILNASGLPTREELSLKVMEEMTLLPTQLIPGPLNSMAQELLNTGAMVYSKRGLDGQRKGYREWLSTEATYPQIKFADVNIDLEDIDLNHALNSVAQKGLGASLKEFLKCFIHFQNKCVNFYNACGI